MINWKDCIVQCRPYQPRKKVKKQGCRSPYNPNKEYVWIAYSEHAPYLPVAIADTPEDIEKMLGLAKGTVVSSFSKYNRRMTDKSRYHRVEVSNEDW